jgi:Zn-dependent protease
LSSPITLLFREPIAFVAFVVTLAIAFTLHEFSHAAAAVAQGDQTPRAQGRLSLNPARHIEPVGALLILIAGIGWARPVEFMPSRLRLGRVGAVLVALVGPIANFVLAFVAAILIRVGDEGGWLYSGSWDIFLGVFFQLNVVLGVFNLLPIPPLDGSRLLSILLPPSMHGILEFLERYGVFILLAILLIPALTGTSLLGPLFEAVLRFIAQLVGIEQILVV